MIKIENFLFIVLSMASVGCKLGRKGNEDSHIKGNISDQSARVSNFEKLSCDGKNSQIAQWRSQRPSVSFVPRDCLNADITITQTQCSRWSSPQYDHRYAKDAAKPDYYISRSRFRDPAGPFAGKLYIPIVTGANSQVEVRVSYKNASDASLGETLLAVAGEQLIFRHKNSNVSADIKQPKRLSNSCNFKFFGTDWVQPVTSCSPDSWSGVGLLTIDLNKPAYLADKMTQVDLTAQKFIRIQFFDSRFQDQDMNQKEIIVVIRDDDIPANEEVIPSILNCPIPRVGDWWNTSHQLTCDSLFNRDVFKDTPRAMSPARECASGQVLQNISRPNDIGPGATEVADQIRQPQTQRPQAQQTPSQQTPSHSPASIKKIDSCLPSGNDNTECAHWYGNQASGSCSPQFMQDQCINFCACINTAPGLPTRAQEIRPESPPTQKTSCLPSSEDNTECAQWYGSKAEKSCEPEFMKQFCKNFCRCINPNPN